MAKTVTKATAGRKGRPPRGQEKVITNRIVEIALGLFLREGYEATSMKRVIEDTGISPGTLYARFPNKEALFRAAISLQVEKWQGNRPVQIEPAKSLGKILERVALGYMKRMSDPAAIAFGKLINTEANRFPEVARLYGENALRITFEEVTESLLATPEGQNIGKRRCYALAVSVHEWVIGWHSTRHFMQPEVSASQQRKAAKRIADTLAASAIHRESKSIAG